jgi:hypothetical protein
MHVPGALHDERTFQVRQETAETYVCNMSFHQWLHCPGRIATKCAPQGKKIVLAGLALAIIGIGGW